MHSHIDELLIEALEKISQAHEEFKQLPESAIESKNRTYLGRAIISIWDFRNKVFEVQPDLKPQFLLDIEEAELKFEKELSLARSLTKDGKIEEASKVLNELSENPEAAPLAPSITGMRGAHKKGKT